MFKGLGFTPPSVPLQGGTDGTGINPRGLLPSVGVVVFVPVLQRRARVELCHGTPKLSSRIFTHDSRHSLR
jgi:hypothetical protein